MKLEKEKNEVSEIDEENYQPMPTSKSNSFLDNTTKTNEYRFGAIVSSYNDFGVTWKNWEFFFTAITEAL